MFLPGKRRQVEMRPAEARARLCRHCPRPDAPGKIGAHDPFGVTSSGIATPPEVSMQELPGSNYNGLFCKAFAISVIMV